MTFVQNEVSKCFDPVFSYCSHAATDVFEASSRILSTALEDASRVRIMTLHQHLRPNEIERLPKILVAGICLS